MTENESPLREKILDISRHMLVSKGHDALSMRKIAMKAEVSATSIYLYFKNKDHLLHTLIEEAVEDLSRKIDEAVNESMPSVDKIRAIINAYVEYAFESPEKYQIIYDVRSDAMSRYPKEKFRKARRCYEYLVLSIKEGRDEGLIEVDDAVLAAYSVWAQLHGVVAVVLNGRLDQRIDQETFINESTKHIIEGFLVRATVS